MSKSHTDWIARLGGRLRPALLRWVVGVFCALIGALMLVAPHQFGGQTFWPIRPWLSQVGIFYSLTGAALVAVSALGTRGPFTVAACGMASLALLTLAGSFALTGGWTGAAIYSVLSVATLVSLFCDASSAPGEDSVDLFVLTAAVAAILNGLLLLTLTAGGLGDFYDPLRATIGWHGGLFLLGGIAVLVTRLRPGIARPVRIAAQLLLGVAFLAWLVGSSIPNRIWTGILLYGGMGSMLVLGPPLARRLGRLDPSSLRLRLALAMASAAAFPLLVMASIATGWEERAAAEQQLALQQAVASGLAADVSGALTQHLVGLTLVAEHPVVLARSTVGRDALLGDVGAVAPGFRALGTFDATGQPLVVLGSRDSSAADRLPSLAVEALQRMPSGLAQPTPFVAMNDQRSIVLAVPIRGESGAPDGVAVGELNRGWLEGRLQQGVAEAHVSAVVADGEGRPVVAAGLNALPGSPGAEADTASQVIRPPIQALRDRGLAGGTLRFTLDNREYLAGYARVDDTDWAVVVQQPVATALASVWISRELTFVVLVAAFLVAAGLGVLLANRLAAPLALLAHAAQALAAGSPTSLMPRSRIYEVRVVARAFSEMQSRLLARTAERERAEARFRILAGASNELTRSLDESAIVQSLVRIIVDELADWCTVDMIDPADVGPDSAPGQFRRVAVLHADASRRALARTLLTMPPSSTPEIVQAAAAGASILAAVVTPRQLAGFAPDSEHRRTLEWLGMRSMMQVPLHVRDQTIGILTCVRGRGSRRYGPDDLALAQELAARAALAIENARLYAAERAARAEAESAVRVRDEFLAVAAHELKTPVTSLRGFAELGVRALDRHGRLEPAVARRTLETIERQSARLTALVSNLLEVARGSADRTQIDPKPVNLTEMARSMVETARVRATEHQFTLTGPEHVEVEADPVRIEQVLTNLLDNAVKYSPPGTLVEVSVVISDDAAQLVVRDHGVGVPPEYRERIFDRFFQAHAAEIDAAQANRDRQPGPSFGSGGQASGMGLGLFICREIVERHGGSIHAELPPDGGLRMVVTLPRQHTDRQAERAERDARGEPAGRHAARVAHPSGEADSREGSGEWDERRSASA